MAQSDIQNYLQSISGIHSLGQQNTPGAVNNGNPNTVYNNPPGGGYLPPVTNAIDQWRINPGSGVNWQQLAMQGGFGSGSGGFGFDLGGIAPPVRQTTPPPSTIPGGGTTPPQTGGGLPPTPVPGTGGGGGGLPTGGGGTGTLTGGLSYFDNRISGGKGAGWGLIPQQAFSGAFTDKSGGGSWSKSDILGGLQGLGDTNINLGQFGQGLANTPLGKALGVTSDGTFDLAQALDWVLPGNVYMAQTGQWNPANIIPALFKAINPLLGIGVSKLMDAFGAKYENVPDDQLNPLQRMLKSRYVKNKQNRHPNQGTAGSGLDGRNPFDFGGFGNPFMGNFQTPTPRGGVWNIQIGGNGAGEIADGTGQQTGTSNNNNSDLPLNLPEFRVNNTIGPVRIDHSSNDGTTHGFQMAFAGGGDLPDVRNFVNDLKTKGGFATK